MRKNNKNIFLVLVISFFIVIILALFLKTNSISGSQSSDKNQLIVGRKLSENYYEFSSQNFKNAVSSGKVVLFFATNWCSTCTQLDRELLKESERLDNGITVLKIDFDKETNLKRDYKVLTQHTLVQVDEKGEEITKWVGGDLEDINQNVK